MTPLRFTAVFAAALAAASCGGGDRSPRPAASPAGVSTTVAPTTASTAASTTSSSTAPSTTVPAAQIGFETELPADAGQLAERIVALETAIRDGSTPLAELARIGQSQQRAYRLLVSHPDWRATVLERVPDELRAVVEANLNAGVDLKALTPPPKSEPPAWQILTPAAADELLTEYKGAEAEFGIGWEYLAAIHLVETRMGRIRGDSVAGAQGPMQFLPSTWRIYGAGGDINSNHDAIRAAARMLRANGAPGNMPAALYAYNPSQRYVRAITAYAGVMAAEERAFFAYHGWQVYYGDRLLPEGWPG